MSGQKSTHIQWHEGLSRQSRFDQLDTHGATLWFTGLSGSGKSTIATALEKELIGRGKHAYRLDGDNLRHGLNSDLGFSPEDRSENIRRVGEVSVLMADSGCLVLSSFISPYQKDRDQIRELHKKHGLKFIEVFIDASVEVCESRDPKGLYKKARAGEIKSFTGISAPYEAPSAPELRIETGVCSIEQAAQLCIEALEKLNILKAG
jgi:adenylylsulfate kinase